MNFPINMLNNHLLSHVASMELPDVQSILDFIHYTYMEYNPIHTDSIRSHFNELNPIMDQLSLEQADLLFHHICDLCQEFEKEAFRDGLYTGAKLATELYLLDYANKPSKI